MSKKLLLAVALAGLAGVAQAAIKLGTVDSSGITQFTQLPDDGPFADHYVFTLGSGNALDIGLTTFFWGSPRVDIPALSFELVGFGSHVVPASVDDDLLTAGYSFSGLTANQSYTLIVSGDESINIGPLYTLQLAANQLAVNQVSEPQSIALVFGALGLMGLLARRRKVVSGECA